MTVAQLVRAPGWRLGGRSVRIRPVTFTPPYGPPAAMSVALSFGDPGGWTRLSARPLLVERSVSATFRYFPPRYGTIRYNGDPMTPPEETSLPEEATRNVKITPTLHGLLQIECDERNVTMQHVADVLLRYGLRDAEIAFAEWNRTASARARQRREKASGS